jgi:hypothetical protein
MEPVKVLHPIGKSFDQIVGRGKGLFILNLPGTGLDLHMLIWRTVTI